LTQINHSINVVEVPSPPLSKSLYIRKLFNKNQFFRQYDRDYKTTDTFNTLGVEIIVEKKKKD
jgi:hypothetical protein